MVTPRGASQGMGMPASHPYLLKQTPNLCWVLVDGVQSRFVAGQRGQGRVRWGGFDRRMEGEGLWGHPMPWGSGGVEGGGGGWFGGGGGEGLRPLIFTPHAAATHPHAAAAGLPSRPGKLGTEGKSQKQKSVQTLTTLEVF